VSYELKVLNAAGRELQLIPLHPPEFCADGSVVMQPTEAVTMPPEAAFARLFNGASCVLQGAISETSEVPQ